ncbi:hypothetical protein HOF92_04095, partial [bacterium]|nr:hypothetical protein [bacterium]
MQQFFESLKQDQILLLQAKRSASRNRKEEKDTEELFIKLYYSTSLGITQIQGLSSEEAVRLLEWKEGVALPHLTRFHLSAYISSKANRRKYLFDASFRSRSTDELLK